MSKIIITAFILLITSGCKYDSVYASKHEIKQMDDWEAVDSPRHIQQATIPQVYEENNSINVPEFSELDNIEDTTFSSKSRIALVIGNSRYKNSPLTNPANDATDIARLLRKLKFDVILKLDANQPEMEDSIAQFGDKLSEGSVGLFYYAGHGVQYEGQNYLIPTKASINRQKDLKYKAVNLGMVLDEMGGERNGLNIAILDACRNNPLPRSFSRSLARGLSRVESPEGTLIAFATSPGSTAADGEGRNGVYTKYLLKYLNQPNISIEKALKLVSREVKKVTNKQQTPWMESSFTGDFYFSKK